MAKGKNFGLYFDGATQIEIGSAGDLKLNNASFTVEVWVKVDRYLTSNNNRDTAILGSNQRNGSVSSLIHLTIRNKRPYIGFFHNDTAGNQVIEEGIWYHLAFVYNKKNQQQLIYVNGKLDADSLKPKGFPLTPQTKSPFIGQGPIVLGNCMGLNSFMLGNMRGLRIWKVALPEGKIRDRMNAEIDKGDPSLTAYWTFEDGFVNNLVGKTDVSDSSSQFDTLKTEFDQMQEKYRQLLIDAKTAMNAKEKLQEELEQHKLEISRLNETMDSEATAASGVSISTLISDANQQIARARNLLKEDGSDYNLGHVNLQFKMIPSGTGKSIIFPSTDVIEKSGDSLSTIDLEFTPKEVAKNIEIPTVEVPDVKGLTEVMARRKIAKAGLMTELKYKAVNKQEQKDRVVQQIPDPIKAPLAEVNTTILIFIGKEII